MPVPDIRTPADPQDKQTTDARSALPPIEFRVTKGTTFNNIAITDRQAPQDRASTTAYRVYFLPAAFAPASSGTTTNVPAPVVYDTVRRSAGRKVASLVSEVAAPGLGATLAVTDAVNFGAEGFYFCVGVNRVKIEAPPEHMVVAPI